MNMDMAHKYRLADGTQVREEDFGLLFYTHQGPRLYFLPSGELLDCDFFNGDMTLGQWLQDSLDDTHTSVRRAASLQKALADLRDKGVIIEF